MISSSTMNSGRFGETPFELAFAAANALYSGVPTLSEIVEYTNAYLRVREIEDWPNALNGLQIENSGRVTKIGAAVDVSTRVLTAAAKKGVDLLIVHHGLFWPGLQTVTGGAGGEIYRDAEAKVDTFVTGEAPHWVAVAAE